MLHQNRTSRYLLYAIGEIFLVVIGILIALQINNWNQGRLDRIKERTYIESLINDLKADTMMIAIQLENSTHSFNAGLMLDSIIRHGELYDFDPIEIIDEAQRLGRVWLPQYNTNTYDDLINTGNFDLIENRELADYIRGYYTNLPYQWSTTFGERNEELIRIMVEVIPLKFHVAVLASRDSPLRQPLEEVMTENEAIEIFEDMTGHPNISFHIKNVTRGHLFHMRLMAELGKGTNELLEILENYKQTL
ncbi:MAG: DUF6090 family protein [Flavobacteriaceae bacterium]|nr:DUF6090 family protein [Flavobacteriaceae bacterium]